jgi:hypothetical protein
VLHYRMRGTLDVELVNLMKGSCLMWIHYLPRTTSLPGTAYLLLCSSASRLVLRTSSTNLPLRGSAYALGRSPSATSLTLCVSAYALWLRHSSTNQRYAIEIEIFFYFIIWMHRFIYAIDWNTTNGESLKKRKKWYKQQNWLGLEVLWLL